MGTGTALPFGYFRRLRSMNKSLAWRQMEGGRDLTNLLPLCILDHSLPLPPLYTLFCETPNLLLYQNSMTFCVHGALSLMGLCACMYIGGQSDRPLGVSGVVVVACARAFPCCLVNYKGRSAVPSLYHPSLLPAHTIPKAPLYTTPASPALWTI